MEVDRVKVSLKYSQLLASGNTKTVEVEAAGTVSPKETWQQAQVYLYSELQRQVMEVFKLPEAKLEAARVQPLQPAQPPMRDPMDPEGIFQNSPEPRQAGRLDHWCVQHAHQFQKHEKGSQVWYSHKVEETDSWCRE